MVIVITIDFEELIGVVNLEGYTQHISMTVSKVESWSHGVWALHF